MRQRILFAKIAGQGAEQTTGKLLSFLQRASAKEFEDFLERLRKSKVPPLLYCCEYLDYWSTGEAFSLLEPKASLFYWSLPDKQAETLAYYFHPFNPQELLGLLAPARKWPGTSDETTWFFQVFDQCLWSWDALINGDSAVLLVRSVVGATLLDEEILNNTSCDLF
jgi:hypothetical protein